MESNVQTEQNNQNIQTDQTSQNQNIQSAQMAVPQENVNNVAGVVASPKKAKKKSKTFLVILLLVLVGGALYLILNKDSFTGRKILSPSNIANGKIEVETGERWGDRFAAYFQEFYVELISDEDEERAKIKASIDREFEILFIDFDFDGTPEMVVKYLDDNKTSTIRIFQYRNGEVNGTKDFRNASFRIVYSFKEKSSSWYIFISSNNKYGAYTLMDKILKGKARDSDIKYNSDKEIATFNNNYATTEYKYVFYGIDEETFADDFKLAVSKYNNEEIEKIKEKLYEEFHDVAPKVDDVINNDPNLVVGEYTLEFGRYVARVPKYENGEEVGYEDKYVTINRNGTITDGTNIIKYNVYGSIFSLETGISFKVTETNKFTYGVGAGFNYELLQ